MTPYHNFPSPVDVHYFHFMKLATVDWAEQSELIMNLILLLAEVLTCTFNINASF